MSGVSGRRSRGAKRYDADYFRRFYLDRATRLFEPRERRARVAVVVATVERWLDRRLRSTLDFGCGAALWGRELARLRPSAAYLGIDPSPALREGRRGKAELRRGGIERVVELTEGRRFDLVLAVDMLHYLSRAEVDETLAALVPRASGALAFDLMTSADAIEGDLDGLIRRSPAWWLERFARHGLVAVGQHIYLPPRLAHHPAELDTARARPRPTPRARPRP